MNQTNELTPDKLFEEFRTIRRPDASRQAIADFAELTPEAQQPFLEPALQFLTQEGPDWSRSWGASLMAHFKAKTAQEKVFTCLVNLLDSATPEEKRTYRYTRFYALRTLERLTLAQTPELTEFTAAEWATTDCTDLLTTADHWRCHLIRIVNKVCGGEDKENSDKDEQGPIWAGALILRAKYGKPEDKQYIDEILSRYKQADNEIDESKNPYWAARAVVRGLREFPILYFTTQLLAILEDKSASELRLDVIKALGTPAYKSTNVIWALSEVIVNEPDQHLREQAVKSLGRLPGLSTLDQHVSVALKTPWDHLQDQVAQTSLIEALNDENAEVRVQATEALLSYLSQEEATSTIIQHTLSENFTAEKFNNMVNALRRIEPDRRFATEILGKESDSEDQQKALLAEKMLFELGGWAAVQRMSHRRNTLADLDKLLSSSEEVIKSTFKDTIIQARRNFYFAMIVNILVVLTGSALIGLAIYQLMREPERWESWLVPGGAGVFGVIINMTFNNPRRNAREDLSTLLNVNIIFLGFLRQLNEIDATFKHAYLEDRAFGTDHMQATVKQIEIIMAQTLHKAQHHLIDFSSKHPYPEPDTSEQPQTS